MNDGRPLEVEEKQRFAFGKNWSQFLENIDEQRIRQAEESLLEMLGKEQLGGEAFLDIGCGSGLFSLAARRLGAEVCSFDYDEDSVSCARTLKERYFPDDEKWRIEQGSVLDAGYMQSLGKYDIVYSWGVLHHTGAMWLAFERAMAAVREGGIFFVAIYNDQGWKSRFWWMVKLMYNRLPSVARPVYAYSIGIASYSANIAKYTLKGRPMDAIRPILGHRKMRGMSVLRDMVDWIGGFPYEFSEYQLLQEYFASRGFQVIRGRRATSLGCHELVLSRRADAFQEGS